MPSITEQAWNPVHYDRAGAFVPQLGSDLIELLAPRPGERVLDLGSGTGDLTARLAASGARPLGLDASSEMVSAAAAKYPQLSFVVGDGQELAYVEEFDAVFSNATLHWMPRAEDAANGIARALRPGGRFVAELGGARCVQTVRDAVRDELSARGVAGYGVVVVVMTARARSVAASRALRAAGGARGLPVRALRAAARGLGRCGTIVVRIGLGRQRHPRVIRTHTRGVPHRYPPSRCAP